MSFAVSVMPSPPLSFLFEPLAELPGELEVVLAELAGAFDDAALAPLVVAVDDDEIGLGVEACLPGRPVIAPVLSRQIESGLVEGPVIEPGVRRRREDAALFSDSIPRFSVEAR